MTISCAPAECEVGGGWAGLPDVLADRRAGEDIPAAQHQQLSAGRKIPVLVEDAVVRQEVLAVDAAQHPVGQHGAGVCEVAVEERAADKGRDSLAGSGDLLERSSRGLDEAGPEEQVLGRIPRDGELGKDDEVRSRSPGLADRIDDQGAVPLEVADDRIELRERQPHAQAAYVFDCKA